MRPNNKINKRLHEENISTAGQKMIIIQYRNSMDIDVQFENGGIAYHKSYQNFKKGNILNPKLHLGEKTIASNGMIMEITEYYSVQNITVTFADSTIVTNKTYNAFKKGTIPNPNVNTRLNNKKTKRINQTSKRKDGTIMTCIEYFDSSNITVQFPDGSIRKNIAWKEFTKGVVAKPEEIKNTNHINETNTAKNGLKMTIIQQEPNQKPVIQFEDGYITRNSPYSSFQRGCVTHNTLKPHRSSTGCVKGTLYNTRISGIAHNYRNTAHYFCECQICKAREIWNFEQIKNHPCNNQITSKNQNTGTDNI